MPKKPVRKPSYLSHKPSGQARVRLDGVDHYLGPMNSPESLAKYDELVRSWMTGKSLDKFNLPLDVLCLKYIEHAGRYYVKNGKPTSEVMNIKVALRYVVNSDYGPKLAKDFGAPELEAVRQSMIDAGCVRTSINRMIDRIRRMFRWAVVKLRFDPAIVAGLESLPGLREGRTEAVESEPVQPVTMEQVDAVKPFVSRQVWALIRFQLLTCARPGEILQMRTGEISMAGDVWEYRPRSHKNQHRGKGRVIFIGPQAQQVIREFLKPDRPEECIFSPVDAKAEFQASRNAARKTPPAKHPRSRIENPKRQPRESYNVSSYGQAIRKACEKAFKMPAELKRGPKNETPQAKTARLNAASEWRKRFCWHPHQLRHTAATLIRKQFGLEAAQILLGHSRADVTQIYAERDAGKAIEIIRNVG